MSLHHGIRRKWFRTALPPLLPPPPPAASPAASSVVSAPSSSTALSTDTLTCRSHQRSRQHPPHHPDGCSVRPSPPSLRGVVARTAVVRAASVARPLKNAQLLLCLSTAHRRRVRAAAAHAEALAAHPCGNARRGCCPDCALAAAAMRSDAPAATRRVAATAVARRRAVRAATGYGRSWRRHAW